MNTLNERIKKLRKDLDLTQQEFANRLGTTRNNIAGYEVGRRSPSEAVISLICKTFNVSETWLRTGEGEMFIPSSNGALDELAQKYGLSARSKVIIEKFLDLKPEVQEAIAAYIEEVAAAFAGSGATTSVPVSASALDTGERTQASTDFEAEARAEAELFYQHRLSEKRRESQASSAKGSGAG